MKVVLWDDEALYESPCGNLVDGLPHDCHTETMVRRADPGPHKMVNYHPKMIELTMFCSITLWKIHRKCCGAHFEDQYGCDKM